MGSKLRQMIKQAKKIKENRLPLKTKHAMTYRCKRCNKEWDMWLQVGLEEFGDDHKPVPYAIGCKCGGIAYHIDWHKDRHLKEPIPIECYMNYFENVPDKDCGYPVLR